MNNIFSFIRNCFKNKSISIDKYIPNCPICLCYFNELSTNQTKLVALSCGHYICSVCVQKLSPYFNYYHILNCPICRRCYTGYIMQDFANNCTYCNANLWTLKPIKSFLTCGHAFCVKCIFKQQVIVYNRRIHFVKCNKCKLYKKLFKLYL